jgi:hypothetical protein
MRRSEVAPRVMNQDGDERRSASLIEASAELKRALVGFAFSPRIERHLERFMLESAGPDEVLAEDEAIDAVDRFVLCTVCRTARPCWTSSWPAGRI